MNCPTCKNPLDPAAKFCGVCGHKNVPVVVAPAPEPAAEEDGDLPANRTLNNRFTILSKIGEGGFGSVYRGVQIATGRKVAIKLLHPEMARDRNLVARFRREGLVLCNLRDSHTITTYDFDQTPDGTLYIAMELLEGRSLHAVWLEQKPLEWKRVCKILGEMCSSLAEAHAQGIVHRDLKPENIYLESRPGNPEFVKILDFGIAKVMKGDTIQTPQLTATGDTLGTLEYMSPEQLRGVELDGRSDVYALGVLGYEMMTGELPFPGTNGPVGLMMAQLKETPKPPSSVNPAIVGAVDRVILKCLAKDKKDRFADVTELANAFTDAIANPGAPPPLAPLPPPPMPPPTGPAPVDVAPPPQIPTGPPVFAPPSMTDMPVQAKPSKLIWILVAAALGVVVAGVAIALR